MHIPKYSLFILIILSNLYFIWTSILLTSNNMKIDLNIISIKQNGFQMDTTTIGIIIFISFTILVAVIVLFIYYYKKAHKETLDLSKKNEEKDEAVKKDQISNEVNEKIEKFDEIDELEIKVDGIVEKVIGKVKKNLEKEEKNNYSVSQSNNNNMIKEDDPINENKERNNNIDWLDKIIEDQIVRKRNSMKLIDSNFTDNDLKDIFKKNIKRMNRFSLKKNDTSVSAKRIVQLQIQKNFGIYESDNRSSPDSSFYEEKKKIKIDEIKKEENKKIDEENKIEVCDNNNDLTYTSLNKINFISKKSIDNNDLISSIQNQKKKEVSCILGEVGGNDDDTQILNSVNRGNNQPDNTLANNLGK